MRKHRNVGDEVESRILAAIEQEEGVLPMEKSDAVQNGFGLFRSDIPEAAFEEEVQVREIHHNVDYLNRTNAPVAAGNKKDLQQERAPQVVVQDVEMGVHQHDVPIASVNNNAVHVVAQPPQSVLLGPCPNNAPPVSSLGPRHRPTFSLGEMSALLHAKNKFKESSTRTKASKKSMSSADYVDVLGSIMDENGTVATGTAGGTISATGGGQQSLHRRHNAPAVSKAKSKRHVEFGRSNSYNDDNVAVEKEAYPTKKHLTSLDVQEIEIDATDEKKTGLYGDDAYAYGDNEEEESIMSHSISDKLRRTRMKFRNLIRPDLIWKNARHWVRIFIRVLLPILGLAGLLYYYSGNPEFWHGASLSWWLIFGVRQTLTYLLARVMEYILIQCVAMRTSIILKAMGPLVTLFFIQSRGGPFTIVWWGIWVRELLHILKYLILPFLSFCFAFRICIVAVPRYS